MKSIVAELHVSNKSDDTIKEALRSFIKKDRSYKNKFLQSEMNIAFDGYSFIGQKDSLNQYDTDMLHSFVLSDFQSVDRFPSEFHRFLKEEWEELKTSVRAIELERIKTFNNPEITKLYQDNVIGYMMSCNYYPKPLNCEAIAKNNTRLSAHKDVSLFSTFPFGIDSGFSSIDTDQNSIALGEKSNTIQFPGYFLEFMSQRKIVALNHQVELPKDLDSERFSFAIFSIPKPNCTFILNGKEIKSNDYYNAYLALF